jgi:hypothetical protein
MGMERQHPFAILRPAWRRLILGTLKQANWPIGDRTARSIQQLADAQCHAAANCCGDAASPDVLLDASY